MRKGCKPDSTALKAFLVFFLLALTSGAKGAADDGDLAAVFLPYDLIPKYSVNYGSDRKPIPSPLQTCLEKRLDGDHAIIISAYNKSLIEDRPASFLTINYSTQTIIDEEPLYVTISDYCVYSDGDSREKFIAAGCYRNDSAFVAKNQIGRDEFELLFLTSGVDQTGNGAWEPSILHIAACDYDFDGRKELFFQVFSGRDKVPRILYCVEMEPLQIEWSLPVASYIPPGHIYSCRDSLNPSIIFASYGTRNGIADENFDDRYGYLAVINSSGKVVRKEIIVHNYVAPILIPIGTVQPRFCLYQMELRDTIPGDEPSGNLPGKLVVVNSKGEISASAGASYVLHNAWLGDYDNLPGAEIYAAWSDGKIRIYDYSLGLIDELDDPGVGGYRGTFVLEGRARPVFLMTDPNNIRIYDNKLRLIAESHHPAKSFYPLAYDSLGNLNQFIVCDNNRGAILEVRKKNFMAYMRGIFIEYHNLILLVLAALLIGLLVLYYSRRKASFRLTESEEKYRALVEGAGEAIFSLDRNGVIRFLSSVAADRFSGKVEDLLGKNIGDILPAETAAQITAAAGDVIKTGRAVVIDDWMILANQKRKFSANLIPLRNAAGEIYEALCISTDKTALHQAMADLEISRGLTASMLDTSNSLIVCLDNQARIVIFNSELERVTGYKRDEVMGKSWPELFLPAEFRHEGLKDFASWVKAHPADRSEGQIITKSGEKRVVLWSNSAVFSPETGRMTMAIAIGHDITEMKKAEMALRESEEILRAMFDSAGDGIIIADLNLNILKANQTLIKMLGLTDGSEIAGRNIAEFMTSGASLKLARHIGQLKERGGVINDEFTIKRKDGRTMPVEIGGTFIHDSNENVVGYTCMIRDCTALKITEARDRARLRLLQELRLAESVDYCLELGCRAINKARLYQRAVLTLHNNRKEITNLGQYGLDPDVVEAARRAPAPSEEMTAKLTQEKFQISHSYFIPAESGVISPDIGRLIEQQESTPSDTNPWRPGDELFVPIIGNCGRAEGWLSVDTPFDGARPKIDVVYCLEEIVDIVAKKINELRSLERLKQERQTLAEINIALHESEERYRSLVDNARDVIFTISPEGVIESLNPSFVSTTGWSIEEWIGRKVHEIIHPDDLSRALALLEEVVRGNTPPVYELRIKSKNGDYLVGEFISAPLKLSGGAVRSLGVARDITQRRMIEKALKESEEKFRAQYQNIPLPTYTWQKHGDDFILIDWNSAAAELTQGKIADYKNIRLDAMYKNSPELARDIRLCFNNQCMLQREMEYKYMTTGRIRQIKVYYSYVPPDLVMVHTEDITERKLADEAVNYRLKFEELITSISTQFINLSHEEIENAINQSLQKAGEFAAVDISFVLILGDDRKSVEVANLWLAPALAGKIETLKNISIADYAWAMNKLQNLEAIYIAVQDDKPSSCRKERETLKAYGISSLVCVPMAYKKEFIGALGFANVKEKKAWAEEIIPLLKILGEIFANALQRRKAERELARINQEKYRQAKQISGGFAHEIRNALFPGRGALSLLEKIVAENYNNDSRLQYYQKLADDAIARAIDITSLISHYTKLDSERQPGIVNPREVIDEILRANQFRIEEQKVRVKSSIPGDFSVLSNRRQLFIAFNNFLLNSLDALTERPDPQIIISAHQDNGFLNIAFEDNGAGIASENLNRIFEAFYSTKPDHGLGLGLSISQKIIEMYGGALSVDNRRDCGAKFNIKLKIAGKEENGEAR
jgi:PAS domain S-box-containing protein